MLKEQRQYTAYRSAAVIPVRRTILKIRVESILHAYRTRAADCEKPARRVCWFTVWGDVI